MIALLQRVSEGRVCVEGNIIGEIGVGLLVMIGIVGSDHTVSAQRVVERILNYRVFADEAGRMNLSLRDIQGGLLLVPQFTLAADTERGNRPVQPRGTTATGCGVVRLNVLQHARSPARRRWPPGRFGAHMQVSLVNDGPVTFWLQSGKARSMESVT